VKRKFVRLLTVSLVAYLVGSAAAGIALADLTLHVPRLPLRHRIAIQQEYRSMFGARLEDVNLVADDGATLRVRAWYARPSIFNGNSVLLLHGVGDNREGMSGYAEFFLAHGYAVLLPDSRAHGESGGSIATYGLLESYDIRHWAEWLKSQSRADCVYGFGESMGAALVLEALRSEPNFCAVVAESPFSTFREVAFDRVGYYVGLGPWFGRTVARPLVESAFLYSRSRYHVDLLEANPKDAVKASHTPVLLIHGQADKNILPWHSQELANVDPNATLWIVPGARHTGARLTDPEGFARRVLTFFAANSSVPQHLAIAR